MRRPAIRTPPGPGAIIARAVLAGWVIATLARLVLPETGLRGQYFGTGDWSGPALRRQIDRELSTAQLRCGWDYSPPRTFSTRWSGHLYVSDSGAYEFTTTSDDGSTVYVDRRLVVDNRGVHGPLAKSGAIRLQRGSHAVVVEYAQRFTSPYMASKAIGNIKRSVLTGAELPIQDALAVERELQQLLFQSGDAKEGLAAYVEKRKPEFKGR